MRTPDAYDLAAAEMAAALERESPEVQRVYRYLYARVALDAGLLEQLGHEIRESGERLVCREVSSGKCYVVDRPPEWTLEHEDCVPAEITGCPLRWQCSALVLRDTRKHTGVSDHGRPHRTSGLGLRRRRLMPLYLWQGAYTAESLAAQMKDPQDRLETAARLAAEAVGGKLLGGGFSFGEYDMVALFEAPDDVSAGAVAVAVAAGGAIRNARTTKLLSGPEWVELLGKATSVANRYRPPR